MATRRQFLQRVSLAGAGALAFKRSHGQDAVVGRTYSSKNKISVFSKHLHWLGYDQMAAAAKEIGFDGVDLTVRPDGHVLPENVVTDLPKAVAAVRKAGLEVYTITTAITEASDRSTENILSVMRDLGIRHYRLNWFSYDQIASMNENLSRMRSRLEKLAVLNEKHRIHGAYQNHAGSSFGSSIWDLWYILKDLNTQYLGCQFDVRHATVEGANSWVNDFKMVQPFIKTHNVKDVAWKKRGDKWVAESVPLGEGMVDFNKYFELIKLYNLNVPISVHYEYPLGGADQGSRTLSIPQEKVIDLMRKDLLVLKSWIS